MPGEVEITQTAVLYLEWWVCVLSVVYVWWCYESLSFVAKWESLLKQLNII